MRLLSMAVISVMFFILAEPAVASLQVQNPTELDSPIPDHNDFRDDLMAAPLSFNAVLEGGIVALANGTLEFRYHAAESGYTNSFEIFDGINWNSEFTEHDESWDLTGVFIKTISVTSGQSLASLIRFTSDEGDTAGPGDNGFGIFWGSSTTEDFSSDLLFFGYDDNGANEDDNHDDMIVSVLFRPDGVIPEPMSVAVWGLLFGIGGFGAIRFSRNRN